MSRKPTSGERKLHVVCRSTFIFHGFEDVSVVMEVGAKSVAAMQRISKTYGVELVSWISYWFLPFLLGSFNLVQQGDGGVEHIEQLYDVIWCSRHLCRMLRAYIIPYTSGDVLVMI
jgi:hypothetical protein